MWWVVGGCLGPVGPPYSSPHSYLRRCSCLRSSLVAYVRCLAAPRASVDPRTRLRAPLVGRSPPSLHSYLPLVTRSTTVAPTSIALRFAPPRPGRAMYRTVRCRLGARRAVSSYVPPSPPSARLRFRFGRPSISKSVLLFSSLFFGAVSVGPPAVPRVLPVVVLPSRVVGSSGSLPSAHGPATPATTDRQTWLARGAPLPDPSCLIP